MKCLQTFCSNLRKTTQQPSNKRLRQVWAPVDPLCRSHVGLKQNNWPCFSQKHPVFPVNTALVFVLLFPQVSSLMLYVEEAHKLPVKYFTNPYCNIYLNSVQVAKTHPREGQNPVFTEEFIFEWVHHISWCWRSFVLSMQLNRKHLCRSSDLSGEINRFEISLSNKTKKSKESDICKNAFSFSK